MSGVGDDREMLAGGSKGVPRRVRNKGRVAQVAPTSRKLFKGKIRAAFLEWFAGTANVALSARKAGIHYRTVLRHRMSDPVFREEFDAALDQGVARVKAWLVEMPEDAGEEIGGDLVPLAPANMDAAMALQLVREHERQRAGGLGKRPGRAPTVASNEEVRTALTKALRLHGVRVRSGG